VDLGRGETSASSDSISAASQWKGRLASKLYAEAQETNGAAAEAQRRVPPPPIPTRGSGDQLDQSDPAWLGELLRGWARQRVLWLHSRQGGKEDPAPSDEGSEAKGLRLDAVE
jgi:hypothetical protein